MTQAPRDGNQTTSIIGVLDSDGTTPTPVQSDPSVHAVKVDDNTTGSVTASSDARRDANQVTTMLAVSNADGATPVELAVNSSGQLLVQST